MNLACVKREIEGLLLLHENLEPFAEYLHGMAEKFHGSLSLLGSCFSDGHGLPEEPEGEGLVSQFSDLCCFVDGLRAAVDEADLSEEEESALNGVAGRIFMSTMME